MASRIVGPPPMSFKIGRNYVRIGDRVHVRRSREGRRDGFDTVVVAITEQGGEVISIDCRDKRNNLRTIPVERVERKAQTRNGVRK